MGRRRAIEPQVASDSPARDEERERGSRNAITTPLYADIQTSLRDELFRLAKDEGFKVKDAVTSLLHYFVKIGADERQSILISRRPLIERLAGAIELIQWGQHSFAKGRWAWCATVTARLLDECNEVPELKRFALYRLGYSLLSLGEELKAELFDALADESLVAATPDDLQAKNKAIYDAFCAGLFYSLESLEYGENPVSRFNAACGYVMLAEASVLRLMPWHHAAGHPTSSRKEDDLGWVDQVRRLIVSWRKEMRNRPAAVENELSETKRWWVPFARQWRNRIPTLTDDSEMVAKVDSMLANSLYHLKLLYPIGDSGQDTGSYTYELVRLAETALDFAFIKWDTSKSADDFRQWVNDSRKESPHLANFVRLRRSLPLIGAIEAFDPASPGGAMRQPRAIGD
jgi:hypothetical protein